MDNKRIAEILINLACDMDYLDYVDNLEDTINLLAEGIGHIESLAPYNNDFLQLFNTLEQIAEVNQYTRDFVQEMRTSTELESNYHEQLMNEV